MIRIALIGCTKATAHYHNVTSRLRGARFAAVVDPDSGLAARTAESFGLSLWATSFENLLRDHPDTFDAAVVRQATGSPSHIVEPAVCGGKHVLLDMPLLLPNHSGNSQIEACRSEDLTLMIGQSMRFSPMVAEVKGCLRANVLGMPGLLRIHDWRPPEHDEQALPAPDDADTPATFFPAIMPDLDLANWIFNALPTEIHAAGLVDSQLTRGSYGYVQVHLGYSDGSMALVDRSTMLPPGSDYFSLSVFGSDGAAYADDHQNMHLLYQGGRPTALAAGDEGLQHVAELQEFVDAIETGRVPAITADDGHRATKVVRAVGQSLKFGRALQLAGSHYELV